MSAEERPGTVIEDLGVTLDLEPGDLISSVLVISSVIREGERQPRLLISASEGMSWVEQAGLLSLAAALTQSEYTTPDDDEDE